MLEAGFKSGRKFSKRLHLWDLLERIHEQLLAEDNAAEVSSSISSSTRELSPDYRRPGDGGVCTPYQETDCKELFHMVVSRISGNNPNIGKDEKVMNMTKMIKIRILYNYFAFSR